PMSPVELNPAWVASPGDLPGLVHVVERRGADLAPIDPTTSEGAARVASFVWADQLDRLQRVRDATLVAQQWPAALETMDAADFVDEIEPVAGHLTVLWHSVMWQYLPVATQRRVAARLEAI